MENDLIEPNDYVSNNFYDEYNESFNGQNYNIGSIDVIEERASEDDYTSLKKTKYKI